MSLGVGIFAIPHFIKQAYFHEGYAIANDARNNWEFCHEEFNTTMLEKDLTSMSEGEPHGLYIALFMLAAFLVGTGMGPIVTIGKV